MTGCRNRIDENVDHLSETNSHDMGEEVLMSDSDGISQLPITGGTPTVLRVPAANDRVALVRALLETALYVDDWSLDDVIDAKVGIDEMCSQVIGGAAEGSSIEVVLHLSSNGMVGEVHGELADGVELNPSSFGWRIVQTVTDTHTVSYSDPHTVDGVTTRPVTIRFSKFRN